MPMPLKDTKPKPLEMKWVDRQQYALLPAEAPRSTVAFTIERAGRPWAKYG